MSASPPGWALTTMGEICNIVSGSTPRTSDPENWGGRIPWITPDDLSGYTMKFIARGRRSLTEKGYRSCSAQLVPAGTVLYTSRAPIGYLAIASEPVCTNQGFKSFVPPDGVLSDYLYWYLKYATPEIRKMGSGTTFLEISKKRAESIPVPIAPTGEQRRIVAAIEEQFSRLDAGGELLYRAGRKLQRMREAVLQAAVEGKLVPQDPNVEPAELLLKRIIEERRSLSGRGSTSEEPQVPLDVGDLPTGWASATLDQLARLITKGTTPTSLGHPFATEGILFIKAESLVDGVVDHKRCAHITEKTHRLLERSQLAENDVLVTIAGTLGRAALVRSVDVPGNTNQAVSLIRLVDVSLARYLLVWLRSPSGQRTSTQRRRGVGLQNISLQDVREAVVPIPPLREQRRIVDEVSRWISLLEDLQATVAACQWRVLRLRQAILRSAFTGRLVPQMPSEESATALLERITGARSPVVSTPMSISRRRLGS